MTVRSLRGLALAALVLAAWAGLLAFTLGAFRLRWETAWMVPALMALQCWLFVGLFIIGHDSMHGSLAPAWPQLNRTLGRLALFLYIGFDYADALPKHHAHHRAPGGLQDPDFHISNRYWPWYLSFMFRYFGWGNVAFVATILAGLTLLGAPPLKIALFWALPAILSSLQLFTFGTYLPHRREARAFADGHNARSNAWPEALSLFTCFHFGYHHEHHLHPGEPWWRLPAVRRGLSLKEKRA